MKQGLTSKEIQYLRGLAHKLDPVVLIGQYGVTAGVVKEIEQTLNSHELIKVKIRCDDQEELGSLVAAICGEVKAVKVQVIGHTAVFYREGKEPKIRIPGRSYAADLPSAATKARSLFGKKPTARAGASKKAKSFPKKRTTGEQRKTRLFH